MRLSSEVMATGFSAAMYSASALMRCMKTLDVSAGVPAVMLPRGRLDAGSTQAPSSFCRLTALDALFVILVEVVGIFSAGMMGVGVHSDAVIRLYSASIASRLLETMNP